jgi:hypothetical protein
MPLLFSYGTLQQKAVQMSVFGRALRGQRDELVGFEQALLTIEEADGTNTYSVVRFNGRNDSHVRGVVLEVSETELGKADEYEPAPYTRISAMLASGKRAWVYADASPS